MRKACIVLCVFLFIISMGAKDQRTGNIFGQIIDTEENFLPRVEVTLIGSNTVPLTTVSSGGGRFRFISLHPGKEYVIKAELSGFKTRVDEGIIFAVGVNTELKLIRESGITLNMVSRRGTNNLSVGGRYYL